MDIKKIVKCRCGIELPIKGGIGNSVNNPIKIIGTFNNVGVENSFITCMIGRNWIKVGQELILTQPKQTIDLIKVDVHHKNGFHRLHFYFDVFLKSVHLCS